MSEEPKESGAKDTVAPQDKVRVFINDHTGNKKREAKLASTAPVRQLVPALVTALGLPATDPSGQRVVYHLAFGDRPLQGEETLATAGVVNGADVTLVPEMTAGSLNRYSRGWVSRGYGFSGLGESLPGCGSAISDGPAVPQSTQLVIGLGDEWHRPVLHGLPAGWSGFPPERGAAGTACPPLYAISPRAREMVRTHTQLNHSSEVGGLLLGQVYESQGRHMVCVNDALPARCAVSGPASLKFTGATWMDLLARRTPGATTVGWYHSHPGFGVFMSGSDVFLHRSFFGDRPWYLALVTDPLSNEQDVFAWRDGKVVCCTVAPDPSDASNHCAPT